MLPVYWISQKRPRVRQELGSLMGAGEVVEIIQINPQLRITWGSAVRHASVKAEEYVASEEITRGKVELARARVANARIGAE